MQNTQVGPLNSGIKLSTVILFIHENYLCYEFN